MVYPSSDRVTRALSYSSLSLLLLIFFARDFYPLWFYFSFSGESSVNLFHFRSPLLTESRLISSWKYLDDSIPFTFFLVFHFFSVFRLGYATFRFSILPSLWYERITHPDLTLCCFLFHIPFFIYFLFRLMSVLSPLINISAVSGIRKILLYLIHLLLINSFLLYLNESFLYFLSLLSPPSLTLH